MTRARNADGEVSSHASTTSGRLACCQNEFEQVQKGLIIAVVTVIVAVILIMMPNEKKIMMISQTNFLFDF